jgi:hypothetical protein
VCVDRSRSQATEFIFISMDIRVTQIKVLAIADKKD